MVLREGRHLGGRVLVLEELEVLRMRIMVLRRKERRNCE